MLSRWLWAGSAAALVGCGGGFDSGATTAGGSGGGSASSGAGVGTSATSTSASTGSGTTSNAGCADGTREAYPDAASEPNIAGCDGRFQLGGITGSPAPACNRQAGNSGTIMDGAGCNVADLCAQGWHVCVGGGEVATHAASHACPPPPANLGVLTFWLTLSRWNPQDGCNLTNANNVAGCGNLGGGAPQMAQNPSACGPLNAVLSVLSYPAQWSPGSDSGAEALYVFKLATGGGGVLCCRN